MRALADVRKEKGLSPKDTVALTVETSGKTLLDGETLPGVASLLFAEVHETGANVELSIGTVRFSIELNAA